MRHLLTVATLALVGCLPELDSECSPGDCASGSRCVSGVCVDVDGAAPDALLEDAGDRDAAPRRGDAAADLGAHEASDGPSPDGPALDVASPADRPAPDAAPLPPDGAPSLDAETPDTARPGDAVHLTDAAPTPDAEAPDGAPPEVGSDSTRDSPPDAEPPPEPVVCALGPTLARDLPEPPAQGIAVANGEQAYAVWTDGTHDLHLLGDGRPDPAVHALVRARLTEPVTATRPGEPVWLGGVVERLDPLVGQPVMAVVLGAGRLDDAWWFHDPGNPNAPLGAPRAAVDLEGGVWVAALQWFGQQARAVVSRVRDDAGTYRLGAVAVMGAAVLPPTLRPLRDGAAEVFVALRTDEGPFGFRQRLVTRADGSLDGDGGDRVALPGEAVAQGVVGDVWYLVLEIDGARRLASTPLAELPELPEALEDGGEVRLSHPQAVVPFPGGAAVVGYTAQGLGADPELVPAWQRVVRGRAEGPAVVVRPEEPDSVVASVAWSGDAERPLLGVRWNQGALVTLNPLACHRSP